MGAAAVAERCLETGLGQLRHKVDQEGKMEVTMRDAKDCEVGSPSCSLRNVSKEQFICSFLRQMRFHSRNKLEYIQAL